MGQNIGGKILTISGEENPRDRPLAQTHGKKKDDPVKKRIRGRSGTKSTRPVSTEYPEITSFFLENGPSFGILFRKTAS
ncbi:hypothetical protein CH375_15090 [Leptospira ellisii]|nr:hypothetical protein CH375_15090 [Leptospira ellisii]